MDENKELLGNGASAPEDAPAAPAAPETEAQALHDELENLAKVFQAELDRAKADAKAVAENAPADPEMELSAPDEVPPASAEKSPVDAPIPEEELCECCGEKRRGTEKDPDSLFCSECDAGLRHYPFDFLNIFFALVALCFVFYGGYVFADHTSTFVAVQKADSLKADKQMYSALDAYASAANTMLNNHINGELVYKREILLAYRLGYMSGISEPAANIRAWELSLPHFRGLKTALEVSAEFVQTAQDASALLAPYYAAAPQDIPYEDILAQLDAMKTAEVATTQSDDDTTASADAYTPEVKKYAPAMLAFYKYYVALFCEKDLETQIAFLEEARDAAPEQIWLYAPLLGELYAKTGRDIEPICQLVEAENAEDDSPVLFRVIAKRIAGEYDDAVSLCEAAIADSSDLADELYRQEALIYLAQGKFTDAYSAANAAYQSTSPSLQLLYTVALSAAAAGQETAYNEVKDLLETNGYTLSAEVTGFKDGTVTLDQILLEGDYDLS